jgi:dUTPase
MKYCLWESCRQCTKDAVDQNTFEFVLLSDGAKVPRKAMLGSTGFDVYSPREVTIHAQKTMKIPLDLSISPPEGTYTRTAARSSLATHHQIICPADVIDPNFHRVHTHVSDKSFRQRLYRTETPKDRFPCL